MRRSESATGTTAVRDMGWAPRGVVMPQSRFALGKVGGCATCLFHKGVPHSGRSAAELAGKLRFVWGNFNLGENPGRPVNSLSQYPPGLARSREAHRACHAPTRVPHRKKARWLSASAPVTSARQNTSPGQWTGFSPMRGIVR